jgi:hypothetical protein
MMLMQFVLKVLYEVIFLPLTLRIIRSLKAREHALDEEPPITG